MNSVLARTGAAILVLAAGTACASPVSTPGPSTAAASPGQGTNSGVGNLPPGCEPIELRAPDGSLLELDGTWIEQSRTNIDQLTVWIYTRGDCLYAVGSVADVPEEGDSMHLGTVIHYTGTIRPDFTIEGQMVHVGPQPSYRLEVPRISETDFLIEFPEEGGIRLRESREAGVVTGGPRCVEQSFCYPPLVLVPREPGP